MKDKEKTTKSSVALSKEFVRDLNQYKRKLAVEWNEDLSLEDAIKHLFEKVAPNEFPDKFRKKNREDV